MSPTPATMGGSSEFYPALSTSPLGAGSSSCSSSTLSPEPTSSDPATSLPQSTRPTSIAIRGQLLPPQKRQCWECQRRRVVCDATQPVCRKCESAGLVCPGFDDKKPLTWLAPGKVSARTRKKRAPNGSRAKAKATAERMKLQDEEARAMVMASIGETAKTRLAAADEIIKAPKAPINPRGERRMYDTTFILFPELVLDRDIEQVFQAMRYYDMVIFEEYEPLLEVVPEAFIRKMDLSTVRYMPDSIRHSIVCLTLGHRIHKLPKGTNPSFVARSWSVFYKERGKAIAALTEDMEQLDPIRRFIALVASGTFLMVDIQQSYPEWRIHYHGIKYLLDICGGTESLMAAGVEINSMIHVYLLIGIFANAITSRAKQLTCVPYEDLLLFATTSYNEKIMPYFMAPKPLLAAIVQINQLRLVGPSRLPDEPSSLPSPESLLADIDAFDPVAWAEKMNTPSLTAPKYLNPRLDEPVRSTPTFSADTSPLVTLANLFKTTTRLYCILALESTGQIPSTLDLEITKALNSDSLFSQLRLRNITQDKRYLLVQKSCLFSVAVAGFLARDRTEEDREFIADMCEYLSAQSGQANSLMLKVVLKEWWDRPHGEDSFMEGWDMCFDSGNALSVA